MEISHITNIQYFKHWKPNTIAELEQEWKQHPVLHFDMSACKNKYEIQQIIEELHSQLDDHERKYKVPHTEGSPGTRFKKLIKGLHESTGLKTVVILDEQTVSEWVMG